MVKEKGGSGMKTNKIEKTKGNGSREKEGKEAKIRGKRDELKARRGGAR